MQTFAGQLTFQNGKCEHTPVPKYISTTHLYDFTGEAPTAKEVEDAHQAALRSFVLPKCAALNEEACLALQKEAMVVDYQISEKDKQICSLVMLSVEASKAPVRQKNVVEQLVSDLNQFVIQSVSEIESKELWLQSPTIVGTGCSAGPIGNQLQDMLKKELLRKEIDVLLSGDFLTPSISIQLRIEAETHADIVYKGSNKKTTLLGSTTLPKTLTPPSPAFSLMFVVDVATA